MSKANLPATFESRIRELADDEGSRGALARRLLDELLFVDGVDRTFRDFEEESTGDGYRMREVLRRVPKGSRATVESGLAFVDALGAQDATQAILCAQMFACHTLGMKLAAAGNTDAAAQMFHVYGTHLDRLERLQLRATAREAKERRRAENRARHAAARQLDF